MCRSLWHVIPSFNLQIIISVRLISSINGVINDLRLYANSFKWETSKRFSGFWIKSLSSAFSNRCVVSLCPVNQKQLALPISPSMSPEKQNITKICPSLNITKKLFSYLPIFTIFVCPSLFVPIVCTSAIRRFGIMAQLRIRSNDPFEWCSTNSEILLL